ncbi:hypothetical protein AKJ08_1575 [Vulgatibacter incomptus]|uniref:Uncharacterized protein n=1 Tax=Vulgatibacter incomptus TaxID=1391653 RepID=A0A0K1PCC3_9BACT|nr:hypothetical protein AKJ08_1575 [Vulgatibacter incomptus]
MVSGDVELASEVSSALGRRGVGAEGTDACPALEASLRREGGLIVVSRRDPVGREVARRVALVEEAASVVESWAQSELNAELMAGWTVGDAAVVEAPHAPAPMEARARRRDPASVVVNGDLSLDESNSLWLGTSLDACVRLGPVCAGGAGRFRRAQDSGRTELAALASVDLPLRFGPLLVSPGIALGGAVSSSFDDSGHGEDRLGSWRPRGEGRIRLSFPLVGPVSLDAAAAAEASPAGAAQREVGDDSVHPSEDPTFFLRVGAGVRVGLP